MLTEGGYNGKQMVSPERKITLPEACWEFWVHIQACFTDLELIWYLYIQKFWVLHIWWRRRNQIFYFSWFSWENVTKNKEDSTSVLETGNFPWYQSHPDPDCPVIPYRSWKNSLEKNVTAVSRVFPIYRFSVQEGRGRHVSSLQRYMNLAVFRYFQQQAGLGLTEIILHLQDLCSCKILPENPATGLKHILKILKKIGWTV